MDKKGKGKGKDMKYGGEIGGGVSHRKWERKKESNLQGKQ